MTYAGVQHCVPLTSHRRHHPCYTPCLFTHQPLWAYGTCRGRTVIAAWNRIWNDDATRRQRGALGGNSTWAGRRIPGWMNNAWTRGTRCDALWQVGGRCRDGQLLAFVHHTSRSHLPPAATRHRAPYLINFSYRFSRALDSSIPDAGIRRF